MYEDFIYGILPDEDDFSDDEEQDVFSRKTYGLDLKNGRICGFVDGAKGIEQMIWKRLLTDRGVYPIYSSDYGFDFYDLIGIPISIAESEVERRIEEALCADDDIEGLSDISFAKGGDGLSFQFTVTLKNGNSSDIEGSIAYL